MSKLEQNSQTSVRGAQIKKESDEERGKRERERREKERREKEKKEKERREKERRGTFPNYRRDTHAGS